LNGIIYDPGRDQFVVVGDKGAVTISDDGVNWSTNDQADTYQFSDLCLANNGRYVAACGDGKVAKSDNGGQTWSLQQVGLSSGPEGAEHFYGVTYGNINGVHTVVVVGRTGVIYTSTDNGVNWTKQDIPEDLVNIWEITFTGSHFVAVSSKEFSGYPYCPILTSPDGFSWTIRDSDATCSYLLTVTYLDSMNRLVAGGQRANFVTSDCAPEALVTEDPQSQTVCEDGSAEFCVTGVGMPPLSYQWERNVGSGWGDISGAAAHCHTINAVGTSDAGQYRCRVWNSYASVTSDPATLTVRVAPQTFTQQPTSQDACEFAAVSFCVTTGEGSSPLSYQWELNTGGGWGDIGGADDDCYTIDPVGVGHAGQYRCRVWNGCGTATSNAATLTVTERARADIDCDGDVDQEDFGPFQMCLTGSGVTQSDPACHDAKLDGDVDVDGDDFAVFLGCLSGPDVPADLDCAD
jgi:hypothetical protein